MAKALPASDEVNAPEKAPHPLALRARAQLRPAASAPLEHGEAEALVLEQRAPVLDDRRHHRNFGGGELEREAVLLLDRRIAPAIRAIELHDERYALLDSHLIDTILVTVQREDAPVGDTPEGLYRGNDDVRSQSVIRVKARHARRTALCGQLGDRSARACATNFIFHR